MLIRGKVRRAFLRLGADLVSLDVAIELVSRDSDWSVLARSHAERRNVARSHKTEHRLLCDAEQLGNFRRAEIWTGTNHE